MPLHHVGSYAGYRDCHSANPGRVIHHRHEKDATRNISASLVVVATFPIEQFPLRLKQGEDTHALLAAIGYYTLLRLHEVVPGPATGSVCSKVAAEIDDKVLSKEYTERYD
jgi:hypothetical protein